MATKAPQKPDHTTADDAKNRHRRGGERDAAKGQAHAQSNGHATATSAQQHTEPLNVGESASIRDIRSAVTTKYNQVFMLTNQSGDIVTKDHGYGLYFRDTQYLDQWSLRIGGEPTIPLLSDASMGDTSRIELTNPALTLPDGSTFQREHLSIRRTQTLHHTITDTISFRNLSQQRVALDMTLTYGSHFTNMFTVRGSQPGKRGTLHPPQVSREQVVLAYDGADAHHRSVTIAFSQRADKVQDGSITYHLCLDPLASRDLTFSFDLVDKGPKSNREEAGKKTAKSGSAQHHSFDKTLQQMPQVETNNALFERALARSFADLRMLATADHNDIFVSAGVPWYVALFGRDSCTAAYQTLAYQPALARTTLEVLARFQGTRSNDYQDEEPGKILHELRLGEKANLHEVPMIPYYGSVDSTPWFLMLICGYVRWTGDLDLFRQLEDNISRALDWIDSNLASNLTGFLTYGSRSENGLTNQGWKDSGNSIVNKDGSLAAPPIALVEVQGYVYHAWSELAQLYRTIGNSQRAQELEGKAADLKKRFNDRYWLKQDNYYALAIERDGSLAEAVASNPGQCFFTGIIPKENAQAVADRLLAADLFCGWGVRTLSADERAYNPLDYQVGSVWPHDNSLIALGLRRYGFTEHMEKVFTGILNAATQFHHFRLPEVFDGFSSQDYEKPVHYPVACSPQAWAAGALPLMLHTCLGFEPDALNHTLHIHRPHLPAWMSSVTIHGLLVGQARVDLQYQRQGDVTLVAVLKREGDIEVLVQY